MKKDKSLKDNPVVQVTILIDEDNASSAKLGEITEVASRYRQVNIKRIYGDWSRTSFSIMMMKKTTN